jgi:hypothetical protein
MENETTEINYWQRARINLNLAKSRQLRVHAVKRRLGRCRFMHMPRRRRLRDWDKITSGCTRSSPIAYKHRRPLLPRPLEITTSIHKPPRPKPTPPHPSPLFDLAPPAPSSQNIAVVCIYSNRLHADASYTASPLPARVCCR